MQGYRISTDQNEIDFKVVHEFLSNSYWAKGIPIATLRKALENSLCFSVFNTHGAQIGFARLITDRATFAYLADVFIVESARGKGISKWLISEIKSHSDLQGLRRIMLATKDAHGLYEQHGFKAVEFPEMLMQIWEPNKYINT